MKNRLLLPVLSLLALAFLLAGGAARSASDPSGFKKIGNPAAIYCKEMGLTYATVSDGQGGEKGTCTMPDSTTCDAWDFLSAKCGVDYSYCAKNGYKTLTLADGKNPYSQEYAVCVDQNNKKVGQATALSRLAEKLTSCGEGNTASNTIPESTAGKTATPLDLTPMALPSSFDWRNNNGNWLTPIKDQGGCGSCWAFSAVGASEAAIKIASKDPSLTPDLSEQYLVSDCNSVSGYQNCCGGWEDLALQYIRDNGIPDEACMTYVDGSSCTCDNLGCGTNCTYRTGGQCSDTTCSNRCTNWSTRLQRISSTGAVSTNRDTIKTALIQKGPLTAAIYWSGNFTGGVYSCGLLPGAANHAIDIVGYDDAGQYWIIRNSWGSSWNGDGYFKLAYGKCRIEQYVNYAVAAPPPPGSFSKLDPADGAMYQPESFTASWSASSSADSYEICADTTNNGTCDTAWVSTASSTEYTFPAGSLPPNVTYYWQVRAVNTTGSIEADSNSWWSFFRLGISPGMDEKLVRNKVKFNWDDLPGATGFKLQLSTDPIFASEVVKTRTTESAYAYPFSLLFSTDYYWRFKPLVDGIYGSWSPVWHFVSMDLIPAPILLSPPNTKLPPLASGSVSFTWNGVDSAVNYKVQVSNTSDFATKLVDETVPTFTLAPSYVFTPGKYFWRVKAINATGGKSPWSEVWIFKVVTTP